MQERVLGKTAEKVDVRTICCEYIWMGIYVWMGILNSKFLFLK